MSRYIGQCDRLRRAGNESAWLTMINQAKPLPVESALNLDLSPILDDNENPATWLQDEIKQGLAVFQSVWNDSPCVFLQCGGFEFIFLI